MSKKVLVVGQTPHASRAIVNDIACSELNLMMVDIADDFQSFLNLLLAKHQDARAIVLMSNTFSRHNVDIQTSVLLLRRYFPTLVIVVIKYEFEELSENEIYQSAGAFLYTKNATGNLKTTPDISYLISQKRKNSWPVIPSQADVPNLIQVIEVRKILNVPEACQEILKYLVGARYFVEPEKLAKIFKITEAMVRMRISLIRTAFEKAGPRFKGVIETLKPGYLFTISPSVK